MNLQDKSQILFPQVKICGLTRPDEAVRCSHAGADAIGLVFFAKSPRNVSTDQAKSITDALPQAAATVGVFVNETFDYIMARVRRCNLSMVQLHGKETPEMVERLKTEGVGVIKGLFINGTPGLQEAPSYGADGYLVECSKGPLPGGNAMAWDWAAARDFGCRYPLVLAGGLSPDNVVEAIAAGLPAAVDLSSSVETSPGRKDSDRVVQLIAAVRTTEAHYGKKVIEPIFSFSKESLP
jgi:phosphoribosylanthranilate isomerase